VTTQYFTDLCELTIMDQVRIFINFHPQKKSALEKETVDAKTSECRFVDNFCEACGAVDVAKNWHVQRICMVESKEVSQPWMKDFGLQERTKSPKAPYG